MVEVVDTIIVGAGLSGLEAAIQLQKAGRSFTILEARDRVGGKIWSVQRPDGKGVQEIGAAWINDSNQSHIWQYCKAFNLTPVVQNVEGSVASEDQDGNCHFFPFGGLPDFPQAEIESITSIRDKFEAASLDPENFKQPKRGILDQLSFEAWCRQEGASDLALRTATVWCRGTLGQEPAEVSVLAFLEVARGALGIINLRYDGKDGAQHLRIKEGTQSIALGMAKLLPVGTIRLNAPVKSIVQKHPRSYVVTTSTGIQLKSRKVIVTVPGPAYKNISFSPSLPPQRQLYTTAVRYGCYVKYLCLFKSPFWRRQGSCGLAQSFRGPMNHCRDTSVDEQENYALTCFLASKPGRSWLQLSEEERQVAVLEQLGSLFAVGYEAVKDELLGTIASEWMQDPWGGWGCPFAAPPPGTIGLSDEAELSSARFEGIHFVGTELTNEWRGYMEGALRSGEKGAQRVLAQLRAEDSSL